MTSKVLLVSNGVGEDMIAASLARRLQAAGADVAAYPLVGTGVYPPEIPLLDPRRTLPSGGFSLRSGLRGLGADLAAGLIGLWHEQRRTLVASRGRYDLVTAVGDTYCLWMAARAAPRVAFVATADSVRICPFGPLAVQAMRRHARRIFARDPETAKTLTAMGLPAVTYGNPIMDLVQGTGQTFGVPPDAPVVTLLPGSRADALGNAGLMLRAAQAIAQEMPEVRFLLAVAPTLAVEEVLRVLLRCEPRSGTPPPDRTAGRGAVVDRPEGRDATQDGVVIGHARITVTTAFADAVARAWVVIGLAGTANEQAAGLGRPVVAFPGPGTQFTPAFLEMQHRLLGDALLPTRTWLDAAAATVRLLRNPHERQRRGDAGRARMGGPGATERISTALLDMLARGEP
jgi:uncharacterized protein (TIGR03492 family)